MDLVLPIAGVTVNLELIGAIGLVVGFVSGLFGIGGGFLMTPLLMFLGVPPAVAVATGSAQLVASATVGGLSAWRHQAIDLRLASILLTGSLAGTGGGIWFFNVLRRLGHLETVVATAYVVLLGSIGFLMLRESVSALRRGTIDGPRDKGALQHWLAGLPFRYNFKEIDLVLSLVPLLLTAAIIGFIGAVLGVGGGFMMVPALIYIFHVPLRVVIGTSQFQILFTMVIATLLHAVVNHAVDLVLAAPLILGGVAGAHLGTLAGFRVKGAIFRLALALLILAVAARFVLSLAISGDSGGSAAPSFALSSMPVWEQWIATEAATQAPLYGIVAILFAGLAGFFAYRLFNRS